MEKLLSLFLPGHGGAGTISRGAAPQRLGPIVCLVGILLGLPMVLWGAESSNNDTLRLSMISGDGKRLLATINGETFAVGEKHKVVLGDRKVVVQCLAIKESSAIVQVGGEASAKELSFGRRAKALAATSSLAPPPAAQMGVAEPEEISQSNEPVRTRGKASALASVVGLGMVVLFFVLYAAFCRSCGLVCRRAGAPSAILVWLPGLQYFALFKAAGVSRWWLFVPFAGYIAWVICCVRLCDTFRVSRGLVVLMLIPLVEWLAFMYLARAGSEEESAPAVRQKFAFEVPTE